MEIPTEASFFLRGTNYRLQISKSQLMDFTISLFDDDQLDRWVGRFTGSFLEEITRRAGAPRTASSFLKMVQCAISGSSPALTFDIVPAHDLAHSPRSPNMYLVVCYYNTKQTLFNSWSRSSAN
jgi:hypothetical protein